MCIDIDRRKLLLVNPGKVKQVISNSRLVFHPGFEKKHDHYKKVSLYRGYFPYI